MKPLIFDATLGWSTDDTTYETIEPIRPDGQQSVLDLVSRHFGIAYDPEAYGGELSGRFRITIERLPDDADSTTPD